MQNHSGLVSGRLLFVNLIHQGAVRAAAARLPTITSGSGEDDRVLFKNKALQENLKLQRGSKQRGGRLFSTCSPSPGGVRTLQEGSWGFDTSISETRNPPRHLSALPHSWGQPLGTSAWLGQALAPIFCRGHPSKGRPGKGC